MEERPSARSTITVWSVIVACVISLIFYAMSIGPAVMLRNSGVISQATFLWLYDPLGWLSHFAPFNRMLEWYLELWT